jgi:TetR/AcrR family transcriptional regulator, tetracycline repressor protein
VEITRSALFTGLTLVMSDPGSKPEKDAAEKTEEQRKQHVRLALLPPNRYPCLVEAALPMSTFDPELHYSFGVDLFVAGVKALAPKP